MTSHGQTGKRLLDEKTFTLETLLLQIASAGQKHNKPYYFGGGIAVDLSFGGLSRPHEDLDLYPLESDTAWWKDWFRSKGYIVSSDSDMEALPNAFSVIRYSHDNFNKSQDYLADVYPIHIGSGGEISMAVKEGADKVWDGMLTIKGARGIWQGKTWNGVRKITYKGQAIALEDYRTVLMQKVAYIRLHPGESLSEKHLYDFTRAGIKPDI
jgi:Aminoglycoside-2''-adenylyltransferase